MVSMEINTIAIVEIKEIQIKSNVLLKSKAKVIYSYSKWWGRCDFDQWIFEEFQTSRVTKLVEGVGGEGRGQSNSQEESGGKRAKKDI